MQSPRKHWRLWLSFTIGWLVIGVTYTFNYYYYAYNYRKIFASDPSFGEMFIWEMPYWILWALLSPLVFSLTRSLRLERGRLLRNLCIHVVALLAISLFHRAVYLFIDWELGVIVYKKLGSLSAVYGDNFFFNLPNGFLCYAAILVAATYYHHHQEEELKVSLLEAERANALVEALKHKLQPHSLSHILNSISSVMDKNVKKAEEMLALLGHYLRMVLHDLDVQEVTVREEMKLLHAYLAIERVHFSDRLTVMEDISSETHDAIVPMLILQPIVENAIRHGISAHEGNGCIDIRSRRENDWLRLEVRDNGPGLHPDKSAGREHKRGLGLANTRERLDGLYGARHRFQLCDAPEGGLRVILEIPYRTSSPINTKEVTQAEEEVSAV